MSTHQMVTDFSALGLPASILSAVEELGYKQPSEIQAQAIPYLLQGRDILGQAQTGTGKTAAFALPILAQIDTKSRATQVLVLTPTRELALQISTAFVKYAKNMSGISILPVYGGQGYNEQISGLKAGAQIVVGTPGRIIDHLERKRLDISNLKTLVLDEADEMLRMGFIDDVEWILSHSPANRQVALFSATMPTAIKSIADRYLKNPAKVTVKTNTKTASTINQYYWQVRNINKLDALSRILEAEAVDGVIVFARTKQGTEELSEQLNMRGFASAALNGDIAQEQRERTVSQLKSGKINIIVATDVAARGLDVERVSHVINYEPPRDVESYIHRIGRTGRAGRSGVAILFVSNQERFFLQRIERSTNQPIKAMEIPSIDKVNEQRVSKFKVRLAANMGQGDLSFYTKLIEEVQAEQEISINDIAASLAKMLYGKENFLLPENRKGMMNSSSEDDANSWGRDTGRNRSKPRIEFKQQGRRTGGSGGYRSDRSDSSDRSDRSDRGDRGRGDRTERGDRASSGFGRNSRDRDYSRDNKASGSNVRSKIFAGFADDAKDFDSKRSGVEISNNVGAWDKKLSVKKPASKFGAPRTGAKPGAGSTAGKPSSVRKPSVKKFVKPGGDTDRIRLKPKRDAKR